MRMETPKLFFVFPLFYLLIRNSIILKKKKTVFNLIIYNIIELLKTIFFNNFIIPVIYASGRSLEGDDELALPRRFLPY